MTTPTLVVDALRGPRIGPVSFDLAARECIAVMGASGAGKTLLLRLLADLDPGEGSVALAGQARNAMPATQWRKRVMLVPAVSGWWAPSVVEHFPSALLAAAASLCATLRLPEDILARDVLGLSTGEKQRLALVRALIESPEVLLLDEPTSGLDAEAVLAVEGCLRERRERGMAMVVVTHDITQARRMASRIFRIADGVLGQG
ncbi:ABC transporter ATP-binding protein [Luteibacter pinisoli]|nr:ABC transporter ATP-binding protein [Luteibacter pinisoli]